MQFQGRGVRKRTGGRRSHFRKKRRSELGREPAETELDEPRFQTIDSRGGRTKQRALATNIATVADGQDSQQVKIEDVVDNPANLNYIRRNIITKGAIIETEAGRARVTSRPGQTGEVNAVLINE